jgi:glycerol-3-phosphate acyltransferase PlsX
LGQQRTTIAVDAVSGDGGPETVLAAARLALANDPDVLLRLVVDPAGAGRLSAFGLDRDERVEIVEAGHVLPMDVGTSQAIRRGPGSSMQLALEEVESGRAGAMVSGGNTGALMALGRQCLGMLPGVERPALMAALPSVDASVWVLDLGANVGVNAHRLCEFAQLGSTAVRVLTGRRPRIGVLNIAREPGKGPDVVREAARLIEAQPGLELSGFVEADQLFAGAVDLVVCDGFAGNVLLKGAEGMARLMFGQLSKGLTGLPGLICRRAVARLYDRLEPSRHNGAPLLGVRGIVIKSHGGACERGFASAIELAALEARRNLIPELEDALWGSD